MVATNLATNSSSNLATNLVGGSGPVTPASILGANLRFRLVADTTWSAGAWVDTVNGVSLAGSGTPTRVTDGSNFLGKSVILFNGTNQGYDSGPLVPVDIIPTASRPWLFFIGRVVSQPAAVAKAFASFDALAAVSEICSIGSVGGTANQIDGRLVDGSFAAFNVTGMAVPSMFEVGLDASGVRTMSRDGGVAQTNGTGVTTAVACRRVLAGASLATHWWNGYIAEILYCAAIPTPAQRAAILAYSQTTYGTP